MAHHPQPSRTLSLAGVPALLPVVAADVDTSLGVLGLIVAIVLLVCVLVAIIAIEALGERRQNTEIRRHH